MTTRSDNKHNRTVLTSMVFVALSLIVAIPAIMLAMAASGTFTSSVTVTSSPPSVAGITGQSIAGTAGTTRTVYIVFNASDSNGWGDLNDTTANVSINYSGETTRYASSCAAQSHPDSLTTKYNCSITLYYYDIAGAWTVNASVKDNSNVLATNTSTTVSVNTIDAVSIIQSSISFSGTPGTSDIASSPNPQQVNNTGNQNYNTIQVTAFSFTSGSNVLSAGNVTMNVSNSGGPGQVLVNNSAVTLTSGSLPKGASSIEDIYFWMDIPASTPAGSYSAQAAWQIATS